MAAIQTRASIQKHGDLYVCPLSCVQVPLDQLRQEVDRLKENGEQIKRVERVNDKEECICIAQGYETSQELTTEVDGQIQIWTERRLLIQSMRSAKAEEHFLGERLEKAEKALQDIVVRKQGKRRLTSRMEIDTAIQQVIKKFRVEGFLDVTVHEKTYEHSVRPYKGKAPSSHQEVVFTISSERKQKEIEYAISHLGWRVYATNHNAQYLTLEQAVEAYRDEYLVERCFGRLKGHPLSIAPLYLQRDDHRIGLVRLLTIALRILTLLESVIRQNLQKQKKEISGLYAGNPKRRTNQPTAEQVLKAFGNLTLTIVHAPEFIQYHITSLSSLQQDLLVLGGFSPLIYLQLTADSPFPARK